MKILLLILIFCSNSIASEFIVSENNAGELIILQKLGKSEYKFVLSNTKDEKLKDIRELKFLNFKKLIDNSDKWISEKYGNEAKNWEIASISLKELKIRKFCYIVSYNVFPSNGNFEGKPLIFNIILNLDGSIKSE